MYVPILQTLQSVYKNENILSMLSPENGIDGKLYDIHNGQYVKSHPLFSNEKHAIKLQLFL